MSGVKLLPCPFCGGEASDAGHTRYGRPLDDTTWTDGSPVTEAFFVNCVVCGADNRGAFTGGFQTRELSIAAWNRRAAPDTPAAGEVGEAARFLIERLYEFEADLLGDEVSRQFYGHVFPAMARLRTILSAIPSAAGWSEAGRLLEDWGDNWIVAKGKLSENEPPYGCQLMVDDEVAFEGEGETLVDAINAAFDAANITLPTPPQTGAVARLSDKGGAQ